MDETELQLKQFTLSDKEMVEKYLSIDNYINSEYSFVTWYGWQWLYAHRHTIIENCLCVFGKTKDSGRGFVNFPLGKKDDIKRAILFLVNYFNKKNKPLVLMSVSDIMLKTLDEIGLLHHFKVENERDREDYVCLRQNFTLLSGKKLHRKRNHYNYFIENYNAVLTPISDDMIPECQKMLAQIIEDRSISPHSELSVTNVLLKNRNALGLQGSILHVDNTPMGVILGEDRSDNVIIHIAKANVSYRGASVALFKLFLEQNFTQCQYVNLMDDMGIEGLRRSKMGWRPAYLAQYNICEYIL